MQKVAIMADSNCGISQEKAKEIGVTIVPMRFCIGDKDYEEGKSITPEEFFQYQEEGQEILSSQPSLGTLMEEVEEVLQEYDAIVYIPMSSALSGSYETGATLVEEYPDRFFVVNNKRISVTQKESVLTAQKLAQEGKSPAQIKEYLEKMAYCADILLTVDNLKYLKKGGRVTPTVATIADILNIKPILTIPGGKIDLLKNVRGRKKSKQMMIAMIKEKVAEYKKTYHTVRVHAAYAGVEEEAAEWLEQMKAELGESDIDMDPLPLNICCHVGRGALGIAITYEKE